QNGGNLTEQDAAKIESLLLDSRCQGTEDWVVAAHFLTGHYFSKLLSGFNYGRPDNCELKVLEHFRAFLEKADRPCESLTVDGEELNFPDFTNELWAAFAYFSNDWGEISRVTNDLSSIALDGLALA